MDLVDILKDEKVSMIFFFSSSRFEYMVHKTGLRQMRPCSHNARDEMRCPCMQKGKKVLARKSVMRILSEFAISVLKKSFFNLTICQKSKLVVGTF